MKFNRIKRFIIITLSLSLILSSVLILSACNDSEDKEIKKGIIILPGLLGSALMEDGEKHPFWDPLTTTDITLIDFFNNPVSTVGAVIGDQNDVFQILYDIIDCKAGTMFPNLLLDEDGENTVNPKVKAVTWDYTGNQRYGAVQAYKQPYEVLEARYGDYYDVRVFQYDWRVDLRYSADALEKMINDEGYDEVVLCAHSMGNLVVANYLAKSEENRGKVTAFLSNAGPYYGSLMALTMLEDPESIIRMLDDFDLNDLPLGLKPQIEPLIGRIKTMYYDYCIDVILNMTSIAQLLPTIDLVNSLQYAYGDSFVSVDGTAITTNEKLIEFYKSRPWAKKENGELRKFVAGLEDYFNGMFIEVDGKRVHSTTLVDTFYFAGTGIKSTDTVYINEGVMTDTVDTILSDGTVPLYSAVIGKSLSDENVMAIEGYDHFDCGCAIEDEMLVKTYEFIDAHITAEILEKIEDAEG